MVKDIITGVAGLGLGMVTDKIAAERQLAMNKEMLNENVKANKELGLFNQELAMQMWNNTNFEAQRKQMEKAGLSVGLMYGGKGGGATTQGGAAGSAAGQGVGMANSGLQGMALMAQIANTKADTELKQAEAAKTRGVDTSEVESRIAKLAAETKNAGITSELLKIDEALKSIELDVAAVTAEERKKYPKLQNSQMESAINRVKEEIRSLTVKADVDEATKEEVITIAKKQVIEQSLKLTLMDTQAWNTRADTKSKEASVTKIAEEIVRMQAQTAQGEVGLSQEAVRIILEQMKTEFGAGEEAKMIRWIETIGGIMGDIGKGMMKKGK